MNINTIRVVDVWAGQVGCLLLTGVRRLVRALGLKRAPSGPVKNVVFIKLIEQGATVLACDALRQAATLVGRENVYFCVFEENRPILDLVDLVPAENVIVIRNRSFGVFVRDMLGAIARMRGMPVDAAVDLEFFSRASAILAYVSGARRRVGCHRFTTEGPYRGDLFTHRLQYNPYLHTATFYSLSVTALSMEPGDVPLPKVPPPLLSDESVPPFVPDAETARRVERLLADHGAVPGRDRIVLLNPNASDLMPLRKWPTERFVELGKRLLGADDGIRVVITGAPSEQASAEAVCREIGSPRAFCLAGKTTLHELMTVYTLADVLVTNDSGPGHFAALTPIDTVVLFGPETPMRYGPIGRRCHVLWAGLACSPCVNAFNHRFSPCRRNECMQVITVDQVLDAVRACLAERSGRA